MLRLVLACALLAACASGTVNPDGGRDVGAVDSTPDLGALPDGGACGDGVISFTEECEDSDFGGETCESIGYAGGTLGCNSDCSFDKTGCEEVLCGNGVIDSGELCEASDLGGSSCIDLGFVGGGNLGCQEDCTYDLSDCSACGDGVVDDGEECDGATFGAATCITRGFTGGTLACDETCGIDDSGCFDADCGDGTRGGSEDCDMADLGGATCADVGLFAGTLGCDADCQFDIGDCHNCGNGSVEGIEQCDGAALGGADCASAGFTMGTLGCLAGCTFDTSGCFTPDCGDGTVESGEACDDDNVGNGDGCSSTCTVETGWTCTGTAPSSCVPTCGDGMIIGSEDCDGANLGGESCIGLGFTGGTLSCTACAFNTGACTTTTCGDGVIDAGEECDDGNTSPRDGCDVACQVEPSYHLPVRLRNGEGSNHGMLEILFEGAWRDVCDDVYVAAQQQAMANIVCSQLGFTGSGHQFINAFGGGSGNPAMDDVQCNGSESTLAQCPFLGWEIENCGAGEAVGIRCMPAEGDIRLVDGPHGMEGRLQIYNAGAWGEVCDDYFDGAYGAYFGYSTTTVCQQLGYADGTFLSTYDAPSTTFVLDDVNCTGTERRIGDCPHPPYGTENCFSTEGAGFRCDVHADGATRLVDGGSRNSGRVEVLHDNLWGTVCDDFISSAGSRQTGFIQVGCSQLGFSSAGSVSLSVPDGIDPIWMDDMNCGGSEASLASCPFAGWGVENCSHFEDVGLTCTP